MQKCLIVMSGLPGSGKSTLAEQLAVALSLPILSIDPIEAAMWRSGLAAETTGVAAYEVARALADEQLRLGLSVIVDAANLIELAREMWRTLAAEHSTKAVMIECVCKDVALHRQRLEQRVRNIPGMDEVTWKQVEHRHTEPRQDSYLEIDTSKRKADHLAAALRYIEGQYPFTAHCSIDR